MPSEATFSRAFAEFAQGDLPDKMQRRYRALLGGRIVGVIARDATEIEAREKPAAKEANDKKDDPPSDGAQPPRKRGRPHKGEQRPKPQPTRLERQTSQNVNQMLAELPTACDVGSKKNSKGYKETWIGYKLHIDVACGQIPVSCVLTSASVHDSQVAIPLMTMTGARVSYLYDLMDAAYDAAAIHDHSRTLGHAPIIDRNFRAQHDVKAEWKREVDRIFSSNARRNDVTNDFRMFEPRLVEGAARCLRLPADKVICYRRFGISRSPPIKSSASPASGQHQPEPRAPANQNHGKFLALREFCKRLPWLGISRWPAPGPPAARRFRPRRGSGRRSPAP